MNKRLILVLALVFALGLTYGAYAEVQNVKVSGDLTIKGVSRNNLDLDKTRSGGTINNDEQDSFLSIARVKVDADLTDNVSTALRLINERDWDGDNTVASQGIDIDLAYVSMKEFLYSPLSVTLGRQELRYGNGLVIGDPDTNNVSAASTLTQSDLSLRKAFDAVKAILNYDPLVVDLIYAKIDENLITGTTANDDVDLYGINANYALDKQTTLEGYFFSKSRGSNSAEFTAALGRTTGAALTTQATKRDLVNTFGGRAVNTSVKNLTAQLEAAYQYGAYNPGYDINSQNAAEIGRRRAWALQAIANYDLKDALSGLAKYSPSIMGTYTFLSGEKNTRTTKSYRGWDPMFEDQTLGHLVNRIMGYSNAQILTFSGKVTPMDDVTLNVDYANYWLNKRYPAGDGTAVGFNTTNLRGVTGGNTYAMTDDRYLGQELDATLTYDYTEDVQFSLLGGVFFPGKAFHDVNESRAGELIGSMKVTF